MKTLLVMRHGKSDWSADYGADHDRPLNDRGARSARVIGEVLTGRGLAPQLIISSTAERARRTAEIAMESGGWDSKLVLEPLLYESGAEGVIEIAVSVAGVDRLLLVGHQPTWSTLVSALTGERVEMKTGTVVVIELDIGQWSELATSRGRVAEVVRPRDHLDSADPD
ncbi:MAG TPA: histidine phosphatase family protein [Acidimicrobiia bacterium]|nr:histidine phosphatase family protein [Acidimicrobiia bacterium]